MATGAAVALSTVRIYPVFHAKFGEYLKDLRKEREWSLRQAAHIASQKKLRRVTRQVMLRLEKGQVKDPHPDTLRQIATLYRVAPDAMIDKFVAAKFRTTTPVTLGTEDESSKGLPSVEGGSGVASPHRGLSALRAQNIQAAARIYGLVFDLAEIAAALLGGEDPQAPVPASDRGHDPVRPVGSPDSRRRKASR